MILELVVISLVSFLAVILTFYSGFGLGTLLTPIFVLFFPVDLAIALTGIVHFLNNIFKVFLIGKQANRLVLFQFGIPAVIMAFIGAWLLINLSDLQPWFVYSLAGKNLSVTPLKFIISLLLFFFSIYELLPSLHQFEFNRKMLVIGGSLSGFFGGLSGHQGAFRSAFLIKAGLTKEAFIGTGVLISCFIDFTRLSVYSSKYLDAGIEDNLVLIIAASFSAFAGAILGKKLLKKITFKFLQKFVSGMLMIIAILLGLGII